MSDVFGAMVAAMSIQQAQYNSQYVQPQQALNQGQGYSQAAKIIPMHDPKLLLIEDEA